MLRYAHDPGEDTCQEAKIIIVKSVAISVHSSFVEKRREIDGRRAIGKNAVGYDCGYGLGPDLVSHALLGRGKSKIGR